MKTLYYSFEKRKGIFDEKVLSNIQTVLNSFSRKGIIQDVIVDKSKIKFGCDEFEDFYLTPSNIRRKELECDEEYSFVCCLVILILKKHYEEDFKFTADCFLNEQIDEVWFKSIKYINKMLKSKIRVENTQILI